MKSTAFCGALALTAMLAGCSAPDLISRKAPVALDNGIGTITACLESDQSSYSRKRMVASDESDFKLNLTPLGPAGPSCHVQFSTVAPRQDVMEAVNGLGAFMKFVDVPGGRLAMYRARMSEKFFFMTQPKAKRAGSVEYEALVTTYDPT